MERVGSAIGGAASGLSNAANTVGNKVNSYETGTVMKILRFLNLINALGLVATGVVNMVFIDKCSGSECVPVGVLAIQLILFGVLLFMYEARIGARYDEFFRVQFGFLYGQYGRLFFILFLASLCFGMLYTSLPYWWVQTMVGGFTIANSWLNCFVIRYHPGFSKTNSAAQESEGIDDAQAPVYTSQQQQQQPSLYSQQPAGGGLYGNTSSGGAGNPFTVV